MFVDAKVMYSCCVSVLGKMPCWYFDKKELENTPSFWNGVDAATEEKYRREGVKLIMNSGSALKLYPIIVPLFLPVR